MKNISKILVILMLSSFAFSSCDDMLDVNSDRFISADDHDMKAANDTLYSMFGVYSQLQKLADRYVLLGELRADLMDVTDTADIYLKEIYNHEISENNPYVQIRDFYAVINNCNYIINNIDTAHVRSAEKVMLKTYAAAKAVRAWTYMQIALNYGKVIYYDKPILSVNDAYASYPEYSMEQLAPELIKDLNPYKAIIAPDYGDTYEAMSMFFPVRFILGDLYLWLGAYTGSENYYEMAAREYRDLMYQNYYTVTGRGTYTTVNNAFTGNFSVYNSFNQSNLVTNIASTNQYSYEFKLDTLFENTAIAGSNKAAEYWLSQHYVHSNTLDTLGDLRMKISMSKGGVFSYYGSNNDVTSDRYSIVKYFDLNYSNDKNAAKFVPVYRVSQLYLRYAEALNRLGKPNTAMAVLKNGLNRTTMSSRLFIPAKELDRQISESIIKSKLDPLVDSIKYDTTYVAPSYMDFTDVRFNFNIGVHALGCGNTQLDTTYLRIPNYVASATSKQDSILYVEDLIQKEMALELAFEGHRFHDLMRFAIRRNDNAYLADIVSAKYPNPAPIRAKLLDRTNWYLKK